MDSVALLEKRKEFRVKVSVVIPMYNSFNTIVSALESVLNQTFHEAIEIIVINDGSTDGCDALVSEMIQSNCTNRIIKLYNQENRGVSTARNCGIKEATGEWIALLDSDDVWLPEKLEKQIEVIEKNPQVKFLGANVNGEEYPFFGKAKLDLFTLNAMQIILKWYPSTPTILAKKSLFIKAGLFDESRRQGEDCDLWLRCLLFEPIYILNETLVHIGHGKKPFGEKGLSADLKKMHAGERFNIKDAFKRKQINLPFYLFAHLWLRLKFLRRVLIIKFSY